MQIKENIEHLVFYAATDSCPATPRDATAMFVPSAQRFARVNMRSKMYPITCSVPPSKRFAQVAEGLYDNDQPLESITFFCHGWKSGIQLGINNQIIERDTMLIEALSLAKHINLYADLTGSGLHDSFAARLARATKARVFAHEARGHAAYNPYVIIYDKDAVWRAYPPPKNSIYTWRNWCEKMKEDGQFTFRDVWKRPYEELGDIVAQSANDDAFISHREILPPVARAKAAL